MGFDHGSKPEKAAATAAPSAQHDPTQAERLVAKCRGNAAELKKLLASLEGQPKLRDAAISAAQRMHGNSFVQSAMNGGKQHGLGSVLGGQKSFGDSDEKAKQPGVFAGAAHAKHGDTFGGGRIGGQGEVFGEGPGMMNTSGNASTDMSTPVRSSNGDSAGTAKEAASSTSGGSATGVLPAPVTKAEGQNTQMKPLTLTPRDDQDTGDGRPVVLGRGDAEAQEIALQRAVGAKTGAAGGANDGRGEGTTTGGNDASGGTAATMREKAGGPAETSTGGAVNYNAALEINQLVNPGSS